MRIRPLLLSLSALLLLLVGPSISAQVVTGTPPFGSFSGGPDIIDNANLNVHYAIPARSKAGRGMNFNYNITYDSSVWQPVPSGSTKAWQPVPGWGWWSGLAAGGQQYILYNVTSSGATLCGDNQGRINEYTFTNFVYYDIVGTPHYFNTSATYVVLVGGEWFAGCPPLGASYPDGQTTSVDGFTMTYSVSGQYAYLTSLVYRNGSQYVVPIGSTPPGSSGSMSITDRNGNVISSSNGAYTDTLGQTALTVTNGTSTTLGYAAPSGATANYTTSYVTKTVRTNFGCSGISEFGPFSESLVNEVTLPDGSYYQFTYEATPGYSGDVTGRVASVKLPTGGTISYTYTGGSNGIECTDGSTSGLQRTTPDTGSAYWTYSRTIGSGSSPNTTTITDPQGNQTTLDFQGMYETQRQVDQGTSTLLKTVYTCYNSSTTPPCNSTAVAAPITKRSITVSWPNGSGTLESQTLTTYNASGLVTEVDEYAYGNGVIGALARKTLTSYASLGNGIIDMPASATIEDGSSNVAAQTTYCYDEATPSRSTTCGATGAPTATSGTPQHVSITGSRGNATTINSLVTGSTYLSEGLSYYDTGNVNVATDVNGGTTTPSYNSTGSCGNSFPTSVAEAVSGLSRSMTWNCVGGVLLTSVDENSQTTTVAYTDPDYWRPASSTDPLNNVTNYGYAIGPYAVSSSLEFNSNSSVVGGIKYMDGLGRLVANQRAQKVGGTDLDTVNYAYDTNGRLKLTTMPCSTTDDGWCGPPETSITYDALDRQLVTTDAGGGTLTLSYVANDAYSSLGPAPTGEHTKDRQYEYDALGRLTSVCEITTTLSGYGTCGQTNSKSGYWTQYKYDVLNNLIKVVQNAQSSTQQTRTYAYDDLSRLTSETTPESGTVTYQYDTQSICWQASSNGDLMVRTDNAGNVTCYYYDKMHRLWDVAGWASNTWKGPCRRYAYDATSNGVNGSAPSGVTVSNIKNRMVEAETDACTAWPPTTTYTDEWFGYTQRGEPSDLYVSSPHSGAYNHSGASYWANGVPDTLSGPLSYFGSYGLDGEGRIYSAGSPAGSTNQLTSTAYNPSSQPTAVNFASGDSDTFTYDPNTGRMTKYTLTVGSQAVVGNLTWNPIGTLETLAITDPFNSSNAQTCSYTHDDLSRIASDNCGSNWSQTFSYDPFGNISKSGTQSFLPTYNTATNQMTAIGSNTPSYDANGNVTNDYLNTYAWDQYGRPTTVNGVTVTYDALGRSVELTNGSTNTEILFSPTGYKMLLLNGSTWVKGFLPLPGGTAEVWTAVANYYRHSDWLGSSRLASLTSGSSRVYYDGAYGPFGEQYANTGTTDLSFTGMDQDISSNVYDFPAREYGIQGRWPSPDPHGGSIVTPQSLNRYSYSINSPTIFVDPSGADTICNTAQSNPTDQQSQASDGTHGGTADWDPSSGGVDAPVPPQQGCNSRVNPFGGGGGTLDGGFVGDDSGGLPSGPFQVGSGPGGQFGLMQLAFTPTGFYINQPPDPNLNCLLGNDCSIGFITGLTYANLNLLGPIAPPSDGNTGGNSSGGLLTKVSDAVKAFGSCTGQHLGLTAATGGTAALGAPVSKAALGLGAGMQGASDTMSVSSAIEWNLFGAAGPKIGMNILGTTRLFGVVGRAAPFVSGALGILDARLIGTCMDQKLGY